jgi:hypothetical protein
MEQTTGNTRKIQAAISSQELISLLKNSSTSEFEALFTFNPTKKRYKLSPEALQQRRSAAKMPRKKKASGNNSHNFDERLLALGVTIKEALDELILELKQRKKEEFLCSPQT